MVSICKEVREPKISIDALDLYLEGRVSFNLELMAGTLERIKQWEQAPGKTATKAIGALERGVDDSLERYVLGRAKIKSGFGYIAAHAFVANYNWNLTRLDGSRGGPVFPLYNAFAISDCLAAGRFNNARVLHEQAIQLSGLRAYEIQALYTEELELAEDPANDVEIIPQRLFAFVHELMGKRAGEAAQPWKDWDIVPDPDYVTAARAVYTEDMEEAAETVCRLCNLHIEHSNPFPEGDRDDHLSGFEFDDPVRAIWPTEIFAWLRLRQERGLPLPEVSHPLLDQPLGRFEPKVPRKIEHEDWFIELIDKLVAFHPRYADLPRMVFDDP